MLDGADLIASLSGKIEKSIFLDLVEPGLISFKIKQCQSFKHNYHGLSIIQNVTDFRILFWILHCKIRYFTLLSDADVVLLNYCEKI